MAHFFGSNNDTSRLLDTVLAVFGHTIGTFLFAWDLEEEQYYISPYATEKYGFPEHVFTNVHEVWAEKVVPEDRDQVSNLFARLRQGHINEFETAYKMLDKNGKPFAVTTHARLLRNEDGKPTVIVGTVAEAVIGGTTDPVTGLMNFHHLAQPQEAAFTDGPAGYLMVVSIDDFPQINAHYGHAFGDRLLRTLAGILQQCAPGGRACRLAGDRFALIMPNTSAAALGQIFQRIRRGMKHHSASLDVELPITVSAGAAAWPTDSDNPTQLQRYADSALVSARRSGKNDLVFFVRTRYEAYHAKAAMQEDLAYCVRNGFKGFSMSYQPLISVADGQVEGAEAFLRWASRGHKQVASNVIVPMLEEDGGIVPVGRWVLDQAIAQCSQWRRIMPHFHMNVNLSSVQLEKDDIVGYVREKLRQYVLPAEALTLEFSDEVPIAALRAFAPIFNRLHALGVGLAMHDAGSGCSCLGSLTELHINRVKIDRRLTHRLIGSDLDFRLIQYIIDIAHGIGVHVTVEGVESEDIQSRLLALHPDTMQGNLYGRPLAPANFAARFVNIQRPKAPLAPAQSLPQGAPEHLSPYDFIGFGEIRSLLDEISEIVMVSDLDTGSIYYLNNIGRQFYGVSDYRGHTCYKLAYGLDAPCANCMRHLLTTQDFTSWEYNDPRTGVRTFTRTKIVLWDNGLARLSINMPFAGNERIVTATRQLKTEKTIVASVQALSGAKDIDEAITAVLGEIGLYHKADRSYVFELSEDGNKASNTYEWCRPSVAPEMFYYSNVDFSHNTPRWLQALKSGKPMVMSSPDAMKERFPKEYKSLLRDDVLRYMMVPYFYGEQVAGFIGVDNPRYAKEDVSLLESLGYFIANETSKRRMTAELHRLSFVDELTGVYNHNRYLKDMAALAEADSGTLGVVFVDIDGLKVVNDSQGHECGDALIRQVAADLADDFGTETVYRIGGDEFVVLCQGIEQDALEQRVSVLRDAASKHSYSVSIGSAWSAQATDIDQLTRLADKKMYVEKNTHYQTAHHGGARRAPAGTAGPAK